MAKIVSDRGYDLRHHVDTAGEIQLDRLKIETTTAALGKRYDPSAEEIFHKSMAALWIRHEDFLFIDIGSGNGKALLMASDYPFQKIIGVEFARQLVEVARRNIVRYRSARQRCRNLETILCDAANYEFPLEPTIYYFHNPFNAIMLRMVVDRIAESLIVQPRPIGVLYRGPTHHEVFDNMAGLKIVEEEPRYVTYTNFSLTGQSARASSG